MMKELSLNILDIVNNSLEAGATLVKIGVEHLTAKDILKISITDNGKGMDKELLERVTDPFVTTRTNRNVGLGLPFFKQAVDMTGGEFYISSEVGKGTQVTGTFKSSHIDRMPMGDLAGTMVALVCAGTKVRFVLEYKVDEKSFILDTDEVKSILGEVNISEAEVLAFLKDYINQGINKTNGGSNIL